MIIPRDRILLTRKRSYSPCHRDRCKTWEEKYNKCDYQNSGVTSEFYTDDNVKERFYGRIEEIWELDYCGEKVPMFRVRWAKSVEREDRYFTTMVIPEAAKSKAAGANMAAKNEPWVLATKVDQCFSLPTRQSLAVLS